MGKEYSSLSSVIIPKEDAQKTIESYKKALNAEVCGIMNCPKNGKVMHACLKLGESTLFLSDAVPEMGIEATGRQEFYLYVDNVDSAFSRATDVGWEAKEAPSDMFWGDRIGIVQDNDGNTWKLAQKIRDVSPEEMQEAMKKMASAV